jgi:hypothetical protein
LIALGAAPRLTLRSIRAAIRQSPRIGFCIFGSRQSAIEAGRYPAFVEGMRDLGYVEGKTWWIEWRFSDGNPERFSGAGG